MNNIFQNVKFDVSYLKSYFAIFKDKTVVNRKDETRKVIEETTKELVYSFEYIPSDIDYIFTTLKNHLQNHPEIFASAFAFLPEILCSCPVVLRDKNGFKQKDIAREFMYANAVWFDVPVKQVKPVWSAPYFDIGKAGEDILLTSYSVPVFDKNYKLMGVVISDLLLAKLEDIHKLE